MKFGRLALGILSLASVTGALQQGCGGDDKEEGASGPGKVPPAAEGTPTPSTEERAYAVNAIALGESDRAGVRNKDAWKKFGFNLDGRITNVTDQNSPALGQVCKRMPGAKPTIHQDGEQGIDNAFGKEVLPLLDAIAAGPSRTVSESIRAGTFTIMLKVVGLTDDPAQTNQGLSGTILVGGDHEGTPAFDMTTDWPFVREPQVPITGAYVNKGVFVNGAGGAQVRLELTIGGQKLGLTVNRAIISFTHAPATKSLEDGTIAGVINTEEFVKGIGGVAGSFDRSFCTGTTLQQVLQSIRQSSDMLADGSQDPGRSCDGISVGLGFSAKQVAIPTKEVVPGPPPPDPCTTPLDAGTD